MQIKKKKQPASIESAKEPADNPQLKAHMDGKGAISITAISQLKAAKKGASANINPMGASAPSAKAPAENAQDSAIVDSEARAKYKARLKARMK